MSDNNGQESTPNPVARALGDFLAQRRWTHFSTLTFRYPTTPDSAIRAFRKWVRWLTQSAECRIGWFYVVEGGGSKRLHIHAMIYAPLSSHQLAKAWDKGRAEVVPFDPSSGACYYCTKTLGTASDAYDFDVEVVPYAEAIVS